MNWTTDVKTTTESRDPKYKIGDKVVFKKKFHGENNKPKFILGDGVVENVYTRSNGSIYYSIKFGKILIRCEENFVAPDTKLFD